MTTPLDILQAQLSAHGWERADPILSPDGSLYRYVELAGEKRCQWIDVEFDGAVTVWGGGLEEARIPASEVTAYLREGGAM